MGCKEGFKEWRMFAFAPCEQIMWIFARRHEPTTKHLHIARLKCKTLQQGWQVFSTKKTRSAPWTSCNPACDPACKPPCTRNTISLSLGFQSFKSSYWKFLKVCCIFFGLVWVWCNGWVFWDVNPIRSLFLPPPKGHWKTLSKRKLWFRP